MNNLIYVLFISIFFLDYLSSNLGLLSRHLTWIPELITIITIFIVSGLFMLEGVKKIPPKIWFFLFLFLSNLVIGVVVNNLSVGPLIAGFRSYLKFIPLFILPFVYHFSNEQISKQLKLLLFFFIIQFPISLYQRVVESKGISSGDYIKGTLGSSGQLTVILTCAIAVLICFYLAKKIKISSFVTIFIILFTPMTINESKSTILLLPIALGTPLLFYSNTLKLKQLIPIVILAGVAGVAFIFIYDHFMRPRWGYGILDFFSQEGRLEGYLYQGNKSDGLLAGKVGNFDAIVIAFKTLYENGLNLFFGLGIGNVSESFLPGLSGEYAEEYSLFKVKANAVSLILWEMGVFGIVLYYALCFMVYKDSKQLSAKDDLMGTFSRGFRVVSILIMVSAAYTNVFMTNMIAYLFWYFSGVIISEKFRYEGKKHVL